MRQTPTTGAAAQRNTMSTEHVFSFLPYWRIIRALDPPFVGEHSKTS